MKRSQNQKTEKINLARGRMMPKQEGFWWTQLETTWFLRSRKRRQRGRCSKHSNINVTLTLRNKLSNMKMTKFENIASYFTRITELRDKLKSSGDNIEGEDLVMTTLNGIPPSWESFIQTISG